MKAHIDKDKPHVIRSETGAVIAVLTDYPLCREDFGNVIVDALNTHFNAKEHQQGTQSGDSGGCGEPK